MTTAVTTPQSRSQTKTRRRTRHELRAAFNQRILTWLSIGIFLFLITFVINMTADLIVRGIRKG